MYATQAEFHKALESHHRWLVGIAPGGQQMVLSDGYTLDHLDLAALDLRKIRANDANFSSAKMLGARLNEAKFYRCGFRDADLTYADLTEATLSYCQFPAATLTDTIWTESKLEHCSFLEANLQDASFYCATLLACDFTGANLYKTHFLNTNLVSCQGIVSVNFDPRGYSLVMWRNSAGTRMFNAGCRCFEYDEALEHWGSGYRNVELGDAYVAAVRMLNEMPDNCFKGFARW